MILTCPACATRYFVDDAKLGPSGKTVRCANCSRQWMAKPEEAPLELTLDPEPEIAPAPESAPSIAEAPPKEIPKIIRARAQTQKTTRTAVVNGVVWAAMGAGLCAVLALGAIFRVDIVRFAPRAASAYAAVGMPVNPVGLTFEQVAAHPGLQDGRAALVVSGVIRNVDERHIPSPTLKINVLDKAGHAVASKVAAAGEGLIAPGQTRPFVIAVLDPPHAARDVDVSFVVGQKTKPAAAKAPHGAAPAAKGHDLSLRGPSHPSPPEPEHAIEATDAKPLDSDSPYALHKDHHEAG